MPEEPEGLVAYVSRTRWGHWTFIRANSIRNLWDWAAAERRKQESRAPASQSSRASEGPCGTREGSHLHPVLQRLAGSFGQKLRHVQKVFYLMLLPWTPLASWAWIERAAAVLCPPPAPCLAEGGSSRGSPDFSLPPRVPKTGKAVVSTHPRPLLPFSSL